MTIAVALRPARPKRRAFTIADIERMTEAGILDPDERLEIIDGEVITMAAKGNRHERVKSLLNYLWGRACPPGFMHVPETGLRLHPETYLEPDFIVFARSKTLADVTGPDILLAVEVADSSLDYDLRRKSRVYARFGVRELWVIDVAGRRIHCHAESGSEGFGIIDERGSAERLVPRHAPAAFAFALDDLDTL